MEFRVEEIAPCKKKVTITVPAERVREEFDTQYREVNKAIAIPGFRPGHVPRKFLETRFGPKIADEVKHKIVESAYETLLKDKKLQPLSRPEVDVEKTPVAADQPFEFGFEVVVRPEFDLPEWKGREVKVPEIAVTDADVDAGVERMLMSEGDLVPAEGAAKEEDVAVLTWSAKEGDVSLDSGEGTYYRIGGTNVLEGFLAEGLDAALVGAKAGDKAKVRGRAAPDDERQLLAGKEFDVWIEMTDLKRFQPAALDAEFLKRRDYDDVDELKKDVRRRIARGRERERDRLAEDRLLEALVEEGKIPLPEEVVQSAVAGWSERRRTEATAEGVSEDAIVQELAASADDVKKRVEGDLRRHFVLEKICDAEDVKVSEQELIGAIEQMARDSDRASGDIAAQFQEQPERLAELRSHLRHQKAREALRRAARIVEEAPPPAAPAKAPAPKKGK
jgi:trigger factor